MLVIELYLIGNPKIMSLTPEPAWYSNNVEPTKSVPG